jgi:DNA-binding MarR family transcriptional regulator
MSQAVDKQAVGSPESRLGAQLRRLLRSARIARQRLAAQATQVQPGMTGVLAILASTADGCHPKELAARCALDASTISRVVAGLVARGLVRRTSDPDDGRACILTLTAAGQAALVDLERQQAEMLATALGDWSGPEIDALAGALARFVDDLNVHLDPTQPETPLLEAAL